VEVGDRFALGRLVKEYAHFVDRRDPRAVANLFTTDGVLAIHHGDPDVVAPDRVRSGRDEITSAMEWMSRYETTTHHLGQQMVEIEGDEATGETYCMAHHIYEADGVRRDRVMSIRYLDTYARVGGEWKFAARRLAVDWIDERVLGVRDG
jgi:hypothetical protein